MIIDEHLYVVLVGVDDYKTYDKSMKWPAGTSNLSGARNDVVAWLRVLVDLGVSANNLYILAAPRLSREEWPENLVAQITSGNAPTVLTPTATNFIEVCQKIGKILETSDTSRTLIVFAGHGAVDTTTNDLVLCFSDYVASGKGGIRMAQLNKMLAGLTKFPQISLVLDACHASTRSGRPGDRVRTLQTGFLPFRYAASLDDYPVLNACLPDESSYEFFIDGQWRGAFSWALLNVLQRWGAETFKWKGIGSEMGNAFKIGHRDAVKKANAFLKALLFAQTPVYSGPVEEAEHSLAELRHGGDTWVDQSLPLDAERELSPDVLDIKNAGGTLVGYFNVTGDTPMTGISANGYANGANEAGLYWLSTDSIAAGASCAMSSHGSSPAPTWSSTTCTFISANGFFGTPTATPTATQWYEWRKVTSTTESIMGYLGITIDASKTYKIRRMTWTGGPELKGLRAKLGTGETFKFLRLTTAPTFSSDFSKYTVAIDDTRLP